jgi:hypothetical protein
MPLVPFSFRPTLSQSAQKRGAPPASVMLTKSSTPILVMSPRQ